VAQDRVIWQAVVNRRVPYYYLSVSVNVRLIRRDLLMLLAYTTTFGAEHRYFITVID
jgi:hypothetical protein